MSSPHTPGAVFACAIIAEVLTGLTTLKFTSFVLVDVLHRPSALERL